MDTSTSLFFNKRILNVYFQIDLINKLQIKVTIILHILERRDINGI